MLFHLICWVEQIRTTVRAGILLADPAESCPAIITDIHHINHPLHYIYGYKAALCDLGLLDREDRGVDPDHFAPGMTEQPLPKDSESLERETFMNIPAASSGHSQAKKVYTLGLVLAEECPDNDCRIYLNIFNLARELDAALDEIEGYPAEVMRRELNKHFRELGRMYYENRAVQMFKEGVTA